MPFSSSTGMATRKGSETMTALASIMPMTFMVSSAHTHQVGARGGLVQHRQARAAHPQALGGRGDLHREAGQHADGVAGADTGGGQAAGDAAGALVDLAPGVPDGLVRFTGDHARRDGAGVAEHLLGESAHDNLLGSGAKARM